MATRIGTIIDGKYEVLKQIGKGGMSVVYLAMDKRLNKQWAVKEIKKTASGKNDEIIINSLLAEANLMKKLDHPALPRIVDIIDNGQTLYVIMDYIEGESLDKILGEYGAQPEDVVISWAMQLCDALNYLHSQKPAIIYRDMKPANIMLKPEGNLKVIDFGIAREYKEQNLADTTVLGTKGYAPPEQHGSRQTDARSDIYALGMTMHHLLTGVDPRPADYIYVPVRQWNPELSEGIEYIIDKCTALDPEDRYQNCDELMYDLQHPDQIGQGVKRIKKKRLNTFLISVALTVVFAVTGVTGQILKNMENENQYAERIRIGQSSAPSDERELAYIEATDIIANRYEAYEGLINLYQEEGRFGEAESKKFMKQYNRHKEEFDTESEEYYDMMYRMAITYFYLYSGDDDSFRARILKADPYFKTIVDSKNIAYEHYSTAVSYHVIGDFYNKYVVNATSVKEPKRGDHEELLESLGMCIANMEKYDYDDAAYVKLTMYQEIENLLNNYRKSFASTGVELEKVLQILEDINNRTKQLSVTQEKSVQLQENILDSYEEYKKSIEDSYSNNERMSSLKEGGY